MKKKSKFSGGESFFAIPHYILNSVAYRNLSAHAVKLLIDIGAEYKGTNNGDLSATYNSLVKKNWHSKGTLNNAIKELRKFGFIEVSRQGGKNKCSLYALTFRSINYCNGKLDISPCDKPKHTWKEHEPIKTITAVDIRKEKTMQLERDKQKLINDFVNIQKRSDEINSSALYE